MHEQLKQHTVSLFHHSQFLAAFVGLAVSKLLALPEEEKMLRLNALGVVSVLVGSAWQ